MSREPWWKEKLVQFVRYRRISTNVFQTIVIVLDLCFVISRYARQVAEIPQVPGGSGFV